MLKKNNVLVKKELQAQLQNANVFQFLHRNYHLQYSTCCFQLFHLPIIQRLISFKPMLLHSIYNRRIMHILPLNFLQRITDLITVLPSMQAFKSSNFVQLCRIIFNTEVLCVCIQAIQAKHIFCDAENEAISYLYFS